jgi:hypothetical protein
VYRLNPDLHVDYGNCADNGEEDEENGETDDGRMDRSFSSKVSDSPDPEGREMTTNPSLRFDSAFESGNLFKAVRVHGRENILINSSIGIVKPVSVSQEYDITLRKDLYTRGNIQWYYFKVEAPETGLAYPITVRFNIINMQKNDSLYNYGMKPAVYSVADAAMGIGWRHKGEDVCYFKNRLTYITKSGKKSKIRNYYSLTFTYTFIGPDSVFFAHSYPYTYTRLQELLVKLESDSRIHKFAKRGLLCKTLAKNRCEILTVTEPCDDPDVYAKRPAVVVSARVHPGETNSSFVMEGLINFLVSNHEDAKLLRQSFVFKLVPMLNPDGVIQGNYRCSLAGTDLNRRYVDPNPHFFPTVHALKDMMETVCSRRPIMLCIDLHGHSKMKNSFSYGCDPTMSSAYSSIIDEILSRSSCGEVITPQKVRDRQVFVRLFPKLMSIISNREAEPIFQSAGSPVLRKQHSRSSKLQSDGTTAKRQLFSYVDCSFKIQPSKKGTGRVVSWSQFGIEASYTIEMSFCGPGDNREAKLLRRIFTAEEALASLRSDCNVLEDVDAGVLGDREENGGGIQPDRLRLGKNELALIDSYKRATHYSIADFKKIGADICTATKLMANIQSSQSCSLKIDPKILQSYIAMSRSIYVDPAPVTDFPISLLFEPPPQIQSLQKFGGTCAKSGSQEASQPSQIEKLFQDANLDVTLPRLTSQSIHEPLLVTSIFQEQSIVDTANSYYKQIGKVGSDCLENRTKICLRILIEGAIRKELELLDAKSRPLVARSAVNEYPNPAGAEVIDPEDDFQIEIAGDNDFGSNEDGGSDSNPSEDNLPMNLLMKNKSFKLLFKGSSVKSKLFSSTNSSKSRRKSKASDVGLLKLTAPTASRIAKVDEPPQEQKAPKFMLPGAIQRLHEGRSVYRNGSQPILMSSQNVYFSSAGMVEAASSPSFSVASATACVASSGPGAAQFATSSTQHEKTTIKVHEFEFETIPSELPPKSSVAQRRATVFIRSRDSRPSSSMSSQRHSSMSSSSLQRALDEETKSTPTLSESRSASQRRNSVSPVVSREPKAREDANATQHMSLADRYERRMSSARHHHGSNSVSNKRDTAFAIAIRLARGELPFGPGAEDSSASSLSTDGKSHAVDWRFQGNPAHAPSTSTAPGRSAPKHGSGTHGTQASDSSFALPAIETRQQRAATIS